MKQLTLTLAALAVAGSAHAIHFEDIEFWSGTGSQRAGFVLQWETGPTATALAWGYRYDGTATVDDMIRSLSRWVDGDGNIHLGADARLFSYGAFNSIGTAIYGFGYDTDNSGVTGSGYTTGPLFDDAVANDSTDEWRVGWSVNGFWSLWDGAIGDETSTWGFASQGVSSNPLRNNGWTAFAFAPASNGWSTEMTENIRAAPVPEPATLVVLAAGAALLARRRRTA